VDVAPGFAPHLFILAVALTTVWATRARRKPAPRSVEEGLRVELAAYHQAVGLLITLVERVQPFIQIRLPHIDQVDFLSEPVRVAHLREEVEETLEVVKQLQGEDDDG
jgi:hypothetical protein